MFLKTDALLHGTDLITPGTSQSDGVNCIVINREERQFQGWRTHERIAYRPGQGHTPTALRGHVA